MARSCRIFGKILWDHGEILQDLGKILSELGKILQDPVRSFHDLAGFMSRSWQDHDRILAKILMARSYWDLGKIVNPSIPGS